MNSAKQCMNSVKQCVNSEPIWGYCSRAEKKKKKKRQKTWTQQNAICKRSHRPTLLHRLNPPTHISLSLYLDFPSCTIHHPHQCTLPPSMALNPTRPSSSLSPPKKAQWKASTSPSLSTTPYHLLKRDFIEIKIKEARWFTYTVVKWMDFERFIACPDQLVYLSRLVMKDSTRDGVKTWS